MLGAVVHAVELDAPAGYRCFAAHESDAQIGSAAYGKQKDDSGYAGEKKQSHHGPGAEEGTPGPACGREDRRHHGDDIALTAQKAGHDAGEAFLISGIAAHGG